MKRHIATAAAVALLLGLSGGIAAQTSGKSKSESLVPIPGTGTAEVKGAKLIGADVINSANDKLGDVDEVLVTTDGRVNAIVVATGGVLGLGERKVVLPWERLRFSSQGSDLVVRTDVSRETLQAMPEYSDRRPSAEQRPSLGEGPAARNRADAEVKPIETPFDTSRPIRPVPPVK